MFYPLEIVLYNKKICFGNRQEKLGSFGFSLLKNYHPQKTEALLGKQYLVLATGNVALQWRRDLPTALPPARDAILETLHILKRIRPFGWIDENEIQDLFSPENVQFLVEHLPGEEEPTELIPGQMSLIDGLETHNGLQTEALALAERMYDTLTFYANLYEELPRLYLKLHHLALRYAWCDKHTPVVLYTIADTDLELNTAAATQISYEPIRPPKGKKTFPGKRMRFSSYSDLIITELFESMQARHYVRLCLVCGKPIFMESCRNQKYCGGMSPYKDDNGRPQSCRQYGAKMKDAETAEENPILVIHKNRCSAIRSEESRGTISPAFSERAKQAAADHMNHALLDPAYAARQYKTDMERDNLYTEVKAKAAQETRPA